MSKLIINDHELKEGEIICSKCGGTGGRRTTAYGVLLGCSKCLGFGYLDWIENILGKKDEHPHIWWPEPAGFRRLLPVQKENNDNKRSYTRRRRGSLSKV